MTISCAPYSSPCKLLLRMMKKTTQPTYLKQQKTSLIISTHCSCCLSHQHDTSLSRLSMRGTLTGMTGILLESLNLWRWQGAGEYCSSTSHCYHVISFVRLVAERFNLGVFLGLTCMLKMQSVSIEPILFTDFMLSMKINLMTLCLGM